MADELTLANKSIPYRYFMRMSAWSQHHRSFRPRQKRHSCSPFNGLSAPLSKRDFVFETTLAGLSKGLDVQIVHSTKPSYERRKEVRNDPSRLCGNILSSG